MVEFIRMWKDGETIPKLIMLSWFVVPFIVTCFVGLVEYLDDRKRV